MRTMLFERLGLSGTTLSEVSQAVSMDGANSAQFDIVVISLSGSGATVTVQLQESNDLENWRDKGASSAPTAVGYTLASAVTAISSAYVRIKATASGTTPIAVVSIGLNTSLQ